MSDDEIKKQKAMLFYEQKEASDRLAALREKATRIGRNIQQFGRWLEGDAAQKLYVRDQEQYGLPVDRLDDVFRDAMSFDGALSLADEIRKATAAEKDLTKRLERHP